MFLQVRVRHALSCVVVFLLPHNLLTWRHCHRDSHLGSLRIPMGAVQKCRGNVLMFQSLFITCLTSGSFLPHYELLFISLHQTCLGRKSRVLPNSHLLRRGCVAWSQFLSTQQVRTFRWFLLFGFYLLRIRLL